MIMKWALGTVSVRGEGGARRCVKQADGWPGQCVDNGNISLLGSNIMLKVNGSWRMEDRNDLGPVSWNEISL